MGDPYLNGIAVHLPGEVLTNEQLGTENPDWDMDRLGKKIGISTRHIAGEGQTASDLAFIAAQKLLDETGARAEVDVLMFCTQSPDYALPATACILQNRLGLKTSCAAFDFNQGCSGYVYGLFLASSMIRAGMARKVLLLTGETYSRFIHPRDRSVRVLFGDAASATLIGDSAPGAKLGNFILGTDGAGANNLIVPAGGARTRAGAETRKEVTDEHGSVRTAENLYMNGQEVFAFTLERIPKLINDLLEKSSLTVDQVDWFVFHQANAFMNEHLRARLKLPKEKTPLFMEDVGNTVSNTIPLTLHANASRIEPGQKVMLVGFGVGYSWGACLVEWGEVLFA